MAAPTGTVTLVFTDIEGSSELWERLGPAFEPVLARHHAAVRAASAARGGHEVKTEGAAFMLAFARASDAVRFALEAQDAFSKESWPPATGELRVRIGLHTGEPICAPDPAGRMDYFGPVVNRAARIAAAAHGGQILVSEAARAAAAEALASAQVTDLGQHRLRGLERPERLWQVLPPSLATRRFGSLKTLSAAPTNLPAQESSFVGRERELSELAAILGDPAAWLVTVTGSPGTGKSRFALRAGLDALEKFPGGVWVADVAEATDAAGVAKAAAAALGVILKPGDPPERALGDVLEFREPFLFLLDNFDQVAGAADASVGRWRQRAPRARFLVTCRSVLGVPGEREFALDPLPAPPRSGDWSRKPELLATYDGVRLFVDRAREADPKFAMTPENAGDIAAICAELEGLPLAIELAAARVRIMKPAQIVSKLGQRFEFLRSGRSGVPARQQTLQGAIAWSYGMLQEWEKEAFEQLCSFRGGFTLDAAEAVLDLRSFPDALPALDAVQRLRERSFLRTWESAGELRFGMFATIREFGERRLRERTDAVSRQGIEERHAAWFASRVAEWAGTAEEDRGGLDRMEADLENVLVAQGRRLERGDAEGAARLLAPLSAFLDARDRQLQVLPRIVDTLARLPAGASGLRSVLARLASEAWRVRGDWAEAQRSAEEALAAARSAGDARILASALATSANLDRLRGHAGEAVVKFEEAMRLREGIGDRLGAAAVAGGLSQALKARGRVAEALAHLERAQGVLASSGRRRAFSRILTNLAQVLAHLGDLKGAIAKATEAQAIDREIGNAGGAAVAGMNRGRYLMDLGELEQAMACFAEAETILRRNGDKPALAFVIRSRGNIHRRRGNYDEALRAYDASEEIELALGNREAMIAQHRSRGHVFHLRGDIDDAQRSYDAAATVAREIGDRGNAVALLNDAATVAAARLRWADVLRLADEIDLADRASGTPRDVPWSTAARARALAETGRAAEALDLVLRAEARDRASANLLILSESLSAKAAILMKLGRPREAIDAAVEALDAFQKFATSHRGDALECRVLKARAEAAVGRADEARRTAEECWKIVDALGLERKAGFPAAQEWIAELRRLSPR